MKNILASGLALIVAYLVVSFAWWLLWNIWWLTISLAKLVLIALIALPFYVIIRRRLLR